MLRDALDRIGEWARRSEAIKTVGVPHQSTRTFLDVGGKLEEIAHEPPARDHVAARLEDLATWASSETEGVEETVTWCSAEQVVTVLDDGHLRRSLVRWELQTHDKFVAASRLQGSDFVSHRELLQSLRFVFRDELGPDFFATLQSVKATGSSITNSETSHGKDSFGKQAAAEIIGAENLPEVVDLELPVWVNFAHSETIRFALQINPSECKFRFAPEPGQMEEATYRAVVALTEAVETKCDGRVMAGKP